MMQDRHAGAPSSNTELCSRYLEWMTEVKRRSPNTVYSYRQTYVSLLDHVRTPLWVVGDDELRAWLHRPRRSGAPSAATVKRELAAVRALFKWMASRGWTVGQDPTLVLLEETPRPQNDDPKPVPFTSWRRVWFAELTDAERVALGLGCFVGLRRAEVASLRADQVVADPRPMLVGVKRKGGDRKGLHFGSCVQLYGERLPEWIGDPVEMFLRPLERLVESRQDRPALLPWADEIQDRYVTRTVHVAPSGQVNPDLVNKRLGALFARLGVPAEGRFTPHQCRHSFGTNLCSVGVPIEVVSQLMGHSSLDMTRRYVDLGADPLMRHGLLGAPPGPEPTPQALASVNRWG